MSENRPHGYTYREERFKLYAAELLDVNGQIEVAESTKVGEATPELYEKRTVLKENIDCLLDQVIDLHFIERQPLEARVYHVTFPGRVNGELRKVA